MIISIHHINLPKSIILSPTTINCTMRMTNFLQSILLFITVLSVAAARSAKYQNVEADPSIDAPQRLRVENPDVVQTSTSGKPRRQTYVRRAQDRHSKATSEYVAASMSMSNDDGYGPAAAEPTPSPSMFEETPAPAVGDISEETGEAEENFGPIDINVDVGGDSNVVTASIQIVQGGGSIDIDSEDYEIEDDDDNEPLDDDDEPIDDYVDGKFWSLY